MRAIPERHLTEKSDEKRLPAVQEIRWQQDRLFIRQLSDAETLARAQIAARDAVISRLQQRLAALEHEPLALRLRTQVEEYAAKLAGERVRSERAEASAAQWKRSAMKNGARYLQLQGRLAQARSECGALEARLERLESPLCSAFTEYDGVSPTSACAATGSGSRTRTTDRS